MHNIFNDNIFHSFLTSAETVDVELDKILEECYQMKKYSKGLEHSNIHGWHSDIFDGNREDFAYLSILYSRIEEFANHVLNLHGTNRQVKKMEWWANINPEGSYNVVHSHPKTDLAVVYYAKVQSEGGSLMLLRNDGAIHTNLFDRVPNAMSMEVRPVAGRMYAFPAYLMHHVTPNLSKEDRVSIAYNVMV